MSLKKSLFMLSAMAMAASMNQDFIPPSVSRGPHYRTPVANQKKCKSCKHYSLSSCPWRKRVNPLDTAFREHYEKRKK